MCTCNSSYLELARANSHLKKRPAYCLRVMILQKYKVFKTKMTMNILDIRK